MIVAAWMTAVAGCLGVIGTVLWAVWYLSAQFSKLVVIDRVRGHEISRLNTAVEKIEQAVQIIAVDRERTTCLERRMDRLEQRVEGMFERRPGFGPGFQGVAP